MQLSAIIWDAREPDRLGRFWTAALGAEEVASGPDGARSRLRLSGRVALDLLFRPTTGPPAEPPRLHPDLRGGPRQREVVERLVGLGARPVDIGQGGVPWVVLADPEGGAFCVLEDRPIHRSTVGPIAALPLDSADPERDAVFWAGVTGWDRRDDGSGMPALRPPSGAGPLLKICPELEPAGRRNGITLGVRGDDRSATAERLRELGARPTDDPDDGAGSWFADPSGNRFCLLAAPDGPAGRP